MKFKSIIKSVVLSIATIGCGAGTMWAAEPTKTPANGYPEFAIGADLSWTSYIEHLGTPQYFTTDGAATDIASITSAHGLDAVRLRVWVDPNEPIVVDGFSAVINGVAYQSSPTHGFCGPGDMVAKAVKFANQGMRVMVCFHLSDTWADPARQFIPASWSQCTSIDDLKHCVTEHITSVLEMLHAANVNIEWVQIGNETSTGMLKYQLPTRSGDAVWPVTWGCGIENGSEATVRNFVEVFSAASNAAKQIYPKAKTLIHIAEGNSWSKIDWTLSMLASQGFSSAICDMVGLSLYPCNDPADTQTYNHTAIWKTDTDNCIATINNINTKYSMPVMLCEIGMNNEWSESTDASQIASLGSQRANIDRCNVDVKDFTEYLLANLRDNPSVCQGLFYWEPETDYLDDYPKGACVSRTPGPSWPRNEVVPNNFWLVCRENTTFPSGGLKDYTTEDAGIETVVIDTPDVLTTEYFNIQGMPLPNAPAKGFYIKRQGAKVTKELALP